MSLTSYRAAPSRVNRKGPRDHKMFDIVNGFYIPLPAKPGGVLLFQRLSGSTIGADWFHVRVRDGIGWGTVALATKLGRQWFKSMQVCLIIAQALLVLMMGLIKCE